jgi:N-acetylneuraminic acid mutarotase
MKTGLLSIFCFITSIAYGQINWLQKANFGGSPRYGAFGFSIGTFGYIGTGWTGSVYTNDFWEYNSQTNAWSQKANFGGGTRHAATGFSIGTKGYAGTGLSGSIEFNDLWEYDPSTNSWTQKATLPSVVRYACTSITIGNKGYLGLGTSSGQGPMYNDFYEYDPSTDTWTQKYNFPGAVRSGAAGFAVGSNGYVGMGSNVTINAVYSDLYCYDPLTNTWTQKASFPGPPRACFISIAIGGNVYGGLGVDFSTGPYTYYNDFWEYFPSSDSWVQLNNFPTGGRWGTIGFAIGPEGYVGTGNMGPYQNDFWMFKPHDVSVIEHETTVASHVYPNPVQDICTITLDKPVVDGQVQMFDLNGKLVYQISNIRGQNFQINSEQLSEGMYVYVITDNERPVSSGKIIVE